MIDSGSIWYRRGSAKRRSAPRSLLAGSSSRQTQRADKNVSTPDWLSDESLAAFMAEVEAPEAVVTF